MVPYEPSCDLPHTTPLLWLYKAQQSVPNRKYPAPLLLHFFTLQPPYGKGFVRGVPALGWERRQRAEGALVGSGTTTHACKN